MKIGQLTRKLMAEEYKKRIQSSEYLFFTNFKGVSADGMRQIRAQLDQSESDVIVVKNSLLRRVLEELEMNEFLSFVEGEIAIVGGKAEPLVTIKKLQELSKSFEGFVIRGGFVEGKIIGRDEIKNLASLPGKDILYAQIVSLIKSPITNIVFILKAPIQYLISILNQIKEKKS